MRTTIALVLVLAVVAPTFVAAEAAFSVAAGEVSIHRTTAQSINVGTQSSSCSQRSSATVSVEFAAGFVRFESTSPCGVRLLPFLRPPTDGYSLDECPGATPTGDIACSYDYVSGGRYQSELSLAADGAFEWSWSFDGVHLGRPVVETMEASGKLLRR